MPRTPSASPYCALFFLTGMACMLLGVLVPSLHLSFTDEQIGRLIASQFLGQLLGALLVTRNANRSLLFGLAVTSAAGFLLGFGDTVNMAVLFTFGLGLGITMTATNILVGLEAPPDRRASRLEILNIFWPLGAACTPAAVRLAGPSFPLRAFLPIALAFLVFLPLLAILRRHAITASLQEDSSQEHAPVLTLLRLCLLCLLAVGVETALSNWIPTFSHRFFSTVRTGGMITSIFWAGVLLGRLTASLLLRFMSWSAFATWASLLTAASVLGVSLSRAPLVFFAAAFCAAFCIAPLYPAVLSRVMHLRRKNLVFFSAGIGSAALPWAVGFVSLQMNSLRLGMLTAAVAALLLALAISQERLSQPVANRHTV